MQWRARAKAIARSRRQQQRGGLAAEDVLALAHVAKPFNICRAAEPDERGLLVARFTGQLFVSLALDRSERKVGPADGRGADALGGVVDEIWVAHRPRARRKARFLPSSSAAASGGASGPGITSCSTTNQPRKLRARSQLRMASMSRSPV